MKNKLKNIWDYTQTCVYLYKLNDKKMEKQIEMTKEEKLDEILEFAVEMVFAGVLLKNVKRHFTNLGVASELADKMVRIAEIRGNELMKYKSK